MADNKLEAAIRARLAKIAASDPVFVLRVKDLLDQSKADTHG